MGDVGNVPECLYCWKSCLSIIPWFLHWLVTALHARNSDFYIRAYFHILHKKILRAVSFKNSGTTALESKKRVIISILMSLLLDEYLSFLFENGYITLRILFYSPLCMYRRTKEVYHNGEQRDSTSIYLSRIHPHE